MKNILLCALGILGLPVAGAAQTGVRVLAPKKFIAEAKADSSAVLLDVRKPEEFAEGHIEGAVNIDWLNREVFDDGVSKLDRRAHTYYIYCRSGRRSYAAAEHMQADGFRVVDMQGGILQWTSEGLPVVK